jgi:ubiquinone/menaquinone biosynthesis C-methylase UbiE
VNPVVANEKLIRKFDKQAGLYESRRRSLTEKDWRETLIRCAEGRVLELSVGAGANFPFYRKDVEVVAVDFSSEMLAKAKQGAAEHGIQASFLLSDVESLSFPEHSFDTIVSTLSFCGYEHPDRVLRTIQTWCKPGGQLLMMEHGLSSVKAFNPLQRLVDPVFKLIVGCHQNRDIVKLVTEAGVKINSIERHTMGMVYLMWASPGNYASNPSFISGEGI